MMKSVQTVISHPFLKTKQHAGRESSAKVLAKANLDKTKEVEVAHRLGSNECREFIRLLGSSRSSTRNDALLESVSGLECSSRQTLNIPEPFWFNQLFGVSPSADTAEGDTCLLPSRPLWTKVPGIQTNLCFCGT